MDRIFKFKGSPNGVEAEFNGRLELNQVQIEKLSAAELAVKSGDSAKAIQEFKDFRESLIRDSNFPGVTAGLLDNLPLNEVILIKEASDLVKKSQTKDEALRAPKEQLLESPKKPNK